MERHTQTVIVGAGQAGLAMSRTLTERGHRHVVLERGQVGQRWTERWDSLRLLTPNWMSRLPGYRYRGGDPDGFMTREEVIAYLADFARSFRAPVEERTAVLSVAPDGARWRVVTDRGTWRCDNVVIATGHCAAAAVPAIAADAPGELRQITSFDYRRPGQLPRGGVLVVGASASGVQLADELHRSGRRIVLAVGRHNRLPRRYRGRDILDWLDRIGTLDREDDDRSDGERLRGEPSLQLAGRPDGRSLDLAVLRARGIELAGRLTGFEATTAHFAGDLEQTTGEAQRKLRRLLERIDDHIRSRGVPAGPAEEPPGAVPVAGAHRAIDLVHEGFRSILWATGYRRSYPWLHAPVLDGRGEIVHRRGRTSAPGLYVLGLQFLIRRRSSFLDGVGRDARELADHILTSRSSREEAAA